MGSYPSEGGRFKAARLPKGWTGPESKSGRPGVRKDTRTYFFFYPSRFSLPTKLLHLISTLPFGLSGRH